MGVATEKQKSFLATLASEKGESVDTNNIEKGPASMEIERLKDLPSSGAGGKSPAEAASDLPAQPLSSSEDAATDKQKRYLAVLEKDGKDQEDEGLSKAEASQKIADLKS